jgi:hypothetical protein
MAAYLLDTGDSDGRPDNGVKDATSKGETDRLRVPKAILTQLGAREEIIREVCRIIIEHRHPTGEGDVNFQIVHDADQLAVLEKSDEENTPELQATPTRIEDNFMTEKGKKLAGELLSKGG